MGVHAACVGCPVSGMTQGCACALASACAKIRGIFGAIIILFDKCRTRTASASAPPETETRGEVVRWLGEEEGGAASASHTHNLEPSVSHQPQAQPLGLWPRYGARTFGIK
jgi:hypothetical protein